jgi:iron complex transport system ATP-binding protein
MNTISIPEAAGLAARSAEAHPMSASLLLVDNAVTRLPGRRFGPFNLQLLAGETVAVLGPSGAGKSTLLKLIAGERAAHEGSVRLHGQDIGQQSPAALAQRRAVLPQSHAVAFGLPVELVVSLGRIARNQSEASHAHIVAQALQMAHAGHLLGRRFDTLSGGEQARVQLARVLAQLWDVEGGLLLVDEPLAALDPGLQFELIDALRDFARQRRHALVAVLHDINQALGSFDRLWLVHGGRLTADVAAGRGAVPLLEALFGITLRVVDSDGERIAVLARPARQVAVEAA